MFATLLGPFPTDPDASAGGPGDAIRATVAELDSAGLELLSDGLPAAVASDEPGAVVARWRIAAEHTSRSVKQAIVGPYTAARSGAAGAAVEDVAERLGAIIEALAEAGCSLVEVEEPAAIAIGDDSVAQRRFVAAHERLTSGLSDRVHLSLALTGGNVDAAGPATFFDLPYASYAFDLIAGPDNWRLIAQAPGDRGIICGALDPAETADDRPEVLVWAAHYAASTRRRGLDRVGLANASSLAGLSRERARGKVRALVDAARLASVGTADELAAAIDPRAVDIRTAATGRYVPGTPRAPRARR